MSFDIFRRSAARTWGFAVILAALVAVLAPSPAAAQDDKTIRIGTTFLLTGKWAVYGLDNKAGMEIALDETNKDGVLGKKLQILWEDTAGDKTVAVALLRKFAGDTGIPLIIQVSTAELGAQAPLAKSIGIPVISTGSVGAGVPLNEWTFRVNLPVTTAVPILIQGAKEKKDVKKFAVIYDMANEFPSSEAKLVEKLSGVLTASIYGIISPFMGANLGLKGLVVMIIGGVSSLSGAVVGGILLGIAEALIIGYISSAYVDAVVFGVLTLMLIARPQGLLPSFK